MQKSAFYSAPCTAIFSRFDFSFPCNFYIRKPFGTTNIPLYQENCGACSLLKFLMAASTRSKKTGINLPFSSKMADICLQIKCREQRDYPPWNLVIRNHGAGIIRHRKDHSSVFVRKILLMSNSCLLCHSVDDSFQFQRHGLELSCQFCCIFFSKLHNLSRLTLMPSFFGTARRTRFYL